MWAEIPFGKKCSILFSGGKSLLHIIEYFLGAFLYSGKKHAIKMKLNIHLEIFFFFLFQKRNRSTEALKTNKKISGNSFLFQTNVASNLIGNSEKKNSEKNRNNILLLFFCWQKNVTEKTVENWTNVSWLKKGRKKRKPNDFKILLNSAKSRTTLNVS